MHTRFLKTLSLRAALLLGSLGALTMAANAQSVIAKANVPFEFAASGAMMPTGFYSLEMSDLSGVVLLRGPSGNTVELLTTFTAMPPATSSAKLIFERRNGMPYLSAIEWPGESARVMSPFKRITKGAVAAALR